MNTALKILLKTLAFLLVFPLYLFFRFTERLLNAGQPFQACSQFLSLFPGIIGNYLRRQFYCLALAKCSDDCCIEFGSRLSQRDTELGRRVYIGANCSIGLCCIEDDVLIGSNVDIISGSKQHYFARLDIPIREQGGELQKIIIGEDSWLGNSSVIMANVGRKSIVAAGSVVTRDVPPYSIVGGNPAKILKNRLPDDVTNKEALS